MSDEGRASSDDFDQQGPMAGSCKTSVDYGSKPFFQKGVMFLVRTKEGESMSAEDASGSITKD